MMELSVRSDEQAAARVRPSPDQVRRQVVDMAADAQRGFPAGPPAHAATDLYLALLQDRLPVYVQTMMDLRARAGQGCVRDNLLPVATGTLDFYAGLLGAKVSAMADPEQLVRIRQAMKARGLGPAAARRAVAGYLRDEQRRGRMDAGISADAVASLLLGGCLSYAFSGLLMGEDDLPPRDDYAAGLVQGLRLSS
jgi:hypothetical protein